MFQPRHACAVVVFSALLLFVLGSANVFAQQPAPTRSTWTITVKADPLTDKTAYTAVDLSASDVGFYELALKCDGASRIVTLSAYTEDKEGRPIPFESSVVETGAARYVGGVRIPQRNAVTSKSFRYRIDDEPASVARLEPAGYANVGRVTKVAAEANAVASLFGITLDVFDRIPAKRLIIADVFPDEDVQFAFAALTPEQRNQMQAMCFPTGTEAAPSGAAKSSSQPSATNQASAPSATTAPTVNADTLAQFVGEWAGRSHVTMMTVGAMTVFLNENPRIAFHGENGPFRSNATVAASPVAFGGQVLLLQVKSPQRLPEPQPASVDPEPVYWIALTRTAGDGDEPNLDMAVFLKRERPAMGVTLAAMCTSKMQDGDECRVFEFVKGDSTSRD